MVPRPCVNSVVCWAGPSGGSHSQVLRAPTAAWRQAHHASHRACCLRPDIERSGPRRRWISRPHANFRGRARRENESSASGRRGVAGVVRQGRRGTGVRRRADQSDRRELASVKEPPKQESVPGRRPHGRPRETSPRCNDGMRGGGGRCGGTRERCGVIVLAEVCT